MSKPGTLYFLVGKMGAGKSTFSKQLTAEKKAILISEDDWLSQLYPNEINSFDDFLVQHGKLLNVVGPHVKQILTAGVSVVLDFPANTVNSRRWYLRLAQDANAQHQAVYLDVSDVQCLENVAKRRIAAPHRANFDTPEMFAAVTHYFEEPEDSEGLNLRTIHLVDSAEE